jgi:hypothetical protein
MAHRISMTEQAIEPNQISERWRKPALVLWFVVVSFLLVLFAVGVPVRFDDLNSPGIPEAGTWIPGLPANLAAGALSHLNAGEVKALQSMGLTLPIYASYIVFFDIALVLVGVVIGLLIVWRKPDSWLALWIAVLVILIGTNGTSQVVPSLSRLWAGWGLVSLFILGYFGMIIQVYLFFMLPDGRFVPDWSRYLAIGFVGFVAGTSIFTIYRLLASELSEVIAFFLILLAVWVVLLGSGIAAQIFRYRRISNQVQRQQAKWLALGLAIVTVGFLFNSLFLNLSFYFAGTQRVILNLVRAPLVNLCLMFLAVGLAMSIFRYRLWDIDLIIRAP